MNFVNTDIPLRSNLNQQIIGLNVSIFGLSKISGQHFDKFMNLFTVQRHSRNPLSYVLSCFTHLDIVHLGMNCLATNLAMDSFQKMYGYDIALGVYLTTGTGGVFLAKMMYGLKRYHKRESVIFVFEIRRYTHYIGISYLKEFRDVLYELVSNSGDLAYSFFIVSEVQIK